MLMSLFPELFFFFFFSRTHLLALVVSLQTVRDIQALGQSARAFQADLASVAAIRALFLQIKEAYPQGINISVLNAGVFVGGPINDFTEQMFDLVFNINTKGTFFAAQESVAILKDGGHLLFVTTAGTRSVLPGSILYAASKAAVDQFARLLAAELGPRRISVNSIAPGFTNTDMFPQGIAEQVASATPMGRVGQPEDIANAVAGLVQAPWITGAIIPVTGGAVIF
jgi:3-oxoacyl-[acyl-carrier protein] reductase